MDKMSISLYLMLLLHSVLEVNKLKTIGFPLLLSLKHVELLTLIIKMIISVVINLLFQVNILHQEAAQLTHTFSIKILLENGEEELLPKILKLLSPLIPNLQKLN